MKSHPIDARVLTVKPHPCQATTNPGTWLVQLRVAHDGRSRSFCRWYTKREVRGGCYVIPSNDEPSHEEILAEFWSDTYAGLHGFDFEE